ncbi:hypothetical protein BV22DRAFT_898667 [Leucogyrophana mollusca]|uniref:Uncharacterized protein n=1 Tax=Leucogyrophana mollusca TaxID=85980 RepID=A0ACB8B222_9AGAM|nr:hypothetical protein BV22DRAFT_898667 [Leucogyrophana mollusca]
MKPPATTTIRSPTATSARSGSTPTAPSSCTRPPHRVPPSNSTSGPLPPRLRLPQAQKAALLPGAHCIYIYRLRCHRARDQRGDLGVAEQHSGASKHRRRRVLC